MRIATPALFAFLFLLAGAGTLFAQDDYYWSGGKKIALEQDRSAAVLVYEDAAAAQGQALAAQGVSGAQAFAADGGNRSFSNSTVHDPARSPRRSATRRWTFRP